MSLDKSKEYDYRKAHFHGLGTIHGGDPDVLRDLGIPVDADDHESHVASGEQVGRLMPTAAQAGRLIGAREQWIDAIHLTHPSSEGPITYATEDQRAATTGNINTLRANIRPLGERSES